LFLLKTFKALNGILCADVPLRNYSLTIACTGLGYQQATKIEFSDISPDIPGRFLRIPDGATSVCVYQFSGRLYVPYTDPLPSPFNATIRHIHYVQLM